MNRSKFLQICVSAFVVIATPISLAAKAVRYLREKAGFMVGNGNDRLDKSLKLFEGDTFTCKVSSKDTDGDIYVFESTRVKEGGPSHHYHFDQDEWWYVLEGQFLIKVGDVVHKCSKGDSVFGPRMIPHSFAKVGEGEGKLLMFFQPAGKMEEFFNKLGTGIAKNMTEEEQEKLRNDHGFKKVGPALTNFKLW